MKRSLRAVIALALMTGAMAVAGPVAALGEIQPGARMVIVDTGGIGTCTLGFVFDGVGVQAGKLYIGTAAHCVTRVGLEVRTLDTLELFGDVAAIGNLASSATDWALIEVRPAFVARVSPAMLNHPQFPTGASFSAQTDVGDQLQLNDLVLIPRQAALTFDDAEIFRYTGTLATPPSTLPLDSGGPIVHIATGKALGTVSRGVNCPIVPVSSLGCAQHEGPTVEGILTKAAAAGFPVTLRTI